MSRPYKYAPLSRFLHNQPPETERVTLTFAEIEAIIGAPLPRRAYTSGRSWWSNVSADPQARSWRSAGWRVAALQRGRGGPREWTVTFNRVVTETTA